MLAKFYKISFIVILLFAFNSSAQNSDDFVNIPIKINNENYKLADFQGKFVLLQFWATWCPYCEKQMPDLVKLQARYKENPKLIILPVSIDEEGQNAVANFYKSRGYNSLPVVLDENKNLYRSFGLRGVPTSILISDKGKIIEIFNSISQLDLEIFDQILQN